jgi:hypothetical protein
MWIWVWWYALGAALAYQTGESVRDNEPRWMVLLIAACGYIAGYKSNSHHRA